MKPALIALLAFVAIQPTFGQVSRPANSRTEQAVLAADRELDRAWNDKDVKALEQLWADDYLFIGWTGEIMTKRERLAAIRTGAFQVQSVESDEVKVRVFEDVAFLTDRERIRTNQGEVMVRSTRAFILRDGRWQLITAQKTRYEAVGPGLTMEIAAKHVSTNGADFAYVERGRGAPILLVHGSLSDFTMWSAQMDALARSHRVIALSRRYHWPNVLQEEPKDYTPQLHANDVTAFIRSLKLGPVHLVGHSYGGFICTYVAKDHPELVRSVTLIEPPIYSFLPPQPEPPPFITAALSLFAKGEDDSAVKSFIAGVEGPGSFERFSPDIQKHMLLNAREMRAELRMPPDRYFPAFTCEDARQIKAPLFLVKGAKSPDFLRAILDQLHACVSSSSETEIPNVSHGVQFENPQAFNDALLQFLAQVEKAPQ